MVEKEFGLSTQWSTIDLMQCIFRIGDFFKRDMVHYVDQVSAFVATVRLVF